MYENAFQVQSTFGSHHASLRVITGLTMKSEVMSYFSCYNRSMYNLLKWLNIFDQDSDSFFHRGVR